LVIRADGGIYIATASGQAPYDPSRLINTSTGAYLSATGVWTSASGRSLKENFTPVTGKDILDKIAQLPISRWNYKSEADEITHIGPDANDFYALFGVGQDDNSISTIDPAGIALAAIQELHRTSLELQQKTDRIEELGAEVAELKRLVIELLEEHN